MLIRFSYSIAKAGGKGDRHVLGWRMKAGFETEKMPVPFSSRDLIAIWRAAFRLPRLIAGEKILFYILASLVYPVYENCI